MQRLPWRALLPEQALLYPSTSKQQLSQRKHSTDLWFAVQVWLR